MSSRDLCSVSGNVKYIAMKPNTPTIPYKHITPGNDRYISNSKYVFVAENANKQFIAATNPLANARDLNYTQQ